jgi:plastocyanin
MSPVRRPRAGVVLTLALVATCSLAACSSSSKSTATTSTTAAATTSSTAGFAGSSTTTSAAPSAGPNGVNIANYAFSPKSLTVKVGTTVSWKNLDQFAHEVKSATGDPGTAFDLGSQAGGKTVTHTFTAAGTYAYYCNIHNYMKGTVVVTP